MSGDLTGHDFAWLFILGVAVISVLLTLLERWQESHRDGIDRHAWGMRQFHEKWQARARQVKREG